MITGRRSTDWLRDAAPPASEGDRRGNERRAQDRRAPRRRIDPLFMATLVSHVAREAEAPRAVYVQTQARAGALINLSA